MYSPPCHVVSHHQPRQQPSDEEKCYEHNNRQNPPNKEDVVTDLEGFEFLCQLENQAENPRKHRAYQDNPEDRARDVNCDSHESQDEKNYNCQILHTVHLFHFFKKSNSDC